MGNFLRLLAVGLCLCLPMAAFASTDTDTAGPTADQALQKLKDGHDRFLKGKLQHPHSDLDRVKETSKGQKPFVSVLGCSDSRASLELLFDAGLGDIFVIRVAGNVADTDEIATVEYGTEHLKTPLVVVLGHTLCGAVTAVVGKGKLEGNLPGLLDNISGPADRAWKKLGSGAAQKDVVLEAVHENTWQSVEDLLKHSTAIAKLVKEGKVKVVGAVYHLEDSSIEWLGEHPRQAELVAMAKDPAEKEEPKAAAEPAKTEGKKAEAESVETTEVTVSSTTVLMTVFVAPLLGALAVLWLFLILFIGEKRAAASLKFSGRLIASFIAVVLTLALGYWYSAVLPAAWHGKADPAWSFWMAVAMTVVFSLIYSLGHVAAFRKFYTDLKAKWAEGK